MFRRGGRPVIGLCAAVERAAWGTWEEVEATVSPRVYGLAVQRSGGLALLLPPDDELAESPDELLDMLDGLVISGGSDIDPASYDFPTRRPTALGRSATASSWRSRTGRSSATCRSSGSAAEWRC